MDAYLGCSLSVFPNNNGLRAPSFCVFSLYLVHRRAERKMKGCDTSGRVERKTVEKNRRMQMKALCFKLSSHIPKSSISKEPLTQQDHLEQAAAYIKTLKERIEQLKQKKEAAINESLEGYGGGGGGGTVSGRSGGAADLMIGLRLPLVEIRARESTLEAVLICVPHRRPLFYDLIAVLEEEGADVVNASFSTVNDKTFYTVHAQVRCPRIGMEDSRLTERLKELVSHNYGSWKLCTEPIYAL